jgi:hypothetical protein
MGWSMDSLDRIAEHISQGGCPYPFLPPGPTGSIRRIDLLAKSAQVSLSP